MAIEADIAEPEIVGEQDLQQGESQTGQLRSIGFHGFAAPRTAASHAIMHHYYVLDCIIRPDTSQAPGNTTTMPSQRI
jgi:hypothetical protein